MSSRSSRGIPKKVGVDIVTLVAAMFGLVTVDSLRDQDWEHLVLTNHERLKSRVGRNSDGMEDYSRARDIPVTTAVRQGPKKQVVPTICNEVPVSILWCDRCTQNFHRKRV